MNQTTQRMGSTPLVDGNVVTGRVVRVKESQVFLSRADKLVHLVLDGQPIQFSRQAMKTTLFIEPLDTYGDSDSVGGRRALIFYGDISGLVDEGNSIEAVVKKRGGALYVRELNNLTTSMRVVPSTQVGCLLAALLLAVAIGVPLLLIAWLVSAILDGSLLNAAAGVLNAFMPCVIVVAGIWMMFRSLLR